MKTKDIDKIAIQIMGWEKRKAYWSLFDSDADHWFEGNERQHNVTSWNPFINIAHAWEVVEKIVKDTNIYFEVCRYGNGEWVTFMGQGNKGFEIDEYADTAPLAICKAALKAMEVE